MVDTLRNLTPHPLTLLGADGTAVTVPPDPAGPAPRPDWVEADAGTVTVDGLTVPIVTTRVGDVPDDALPAPVPGVWLVVSRATAEAARHRYDLVVPHRMEWTTAPDGTKRPQGAYALARVVTA